MAGGDVGAGISLLVHKSILLPVAMYVQALVEICTVESLYRIEDQEEGKEKESITTTLNWKSTAHTPKCRHRLFDSRPIDL